MTTSLFLSRRRSAGRIKEEAMENHHQCWRVKLYQLEIGGIWNDQGTGFVSCEQVANDENTEPHVYRGCLVVRREGDNSVLLQSIIQYEDAYERQGESIIMWRENCPVDGNEIDYALSFENTAGCYSIWDAIIDIQGFPYKMSTHDRGSSSSSYEKEGATQQIYQGYSYNEMNREWLPANGGVAGDGEHGKVNGEGMHEGFVRSISSPHGVGSSALYMHELASAYIGLPSVSAGNLEEIKDKILNAFPSQKEVYASLILEKGGEYIHKLLKLSEESRLSKKEDICQRIAEIIRGIVYLNDTAILEVLINNHDIFYRVAGVMEHDPKLKERGNFRERLSRNPSGPKCIVGDNFGNGDVTEPSQGNQQSDKAAKGVPSTSVLGRAAGIVTKLFRTRMLKECMIRPLLDESGATALSALQHTLQSDICSLMFKDTSYLGKMLDLIVEPSKEMRKEKWFYDVEVDFNDDVRGEDDKEGNSFSKTKDSLCFLRELIFMSRQLSIEQRSILYSNCLNKLRIPFFSALKCMLCKRDDASFPNVIGINSQLLEEKSYANTLRIMAAEILCSVTHVCPTFLRQTIIEGPVPTSPPYCSSSIGGAPPVSGRQYDNDCSILYVIIERICCDEEASVVEHLGETLKVLLDPERLDQLEKDRFLALFYDYYVHWMLVPFAFEESLPEDSCRFSSHIAFSNTEDVARENRTALDRSRVTSQEQFSAISSSRRNLCEIFSQCVQCHSYRMKFFIVRNNVISRILKLLRSRHRHMHIGAIKFIRTIISVKDEFYYKNIVKYDSLKPMLDLFLSICMKDNLITSAIVEIFDYIRAERIVTLMRFFIEKYRLIFSRCLGEKESDVCEKNAAKNAARDNEVCESSKRVLLHEEVFRKFLQTHEQILEYGNVSEGAGSGPYFESNQVSAHGMVDVGLFRNKMNRSLADLESEDAYFFEADGDEDSSIRDVNTQGSDVEYGPMPMPSIIQGQSGKNNKLKRSYFDGLGDASGNPVDSRNKHAGEFSGGKSANSLKLISDLYGEDDGKSGISGIASENNGNSGSGTPRLCYSPPPPGLPPLRSKFYSDSDDEGEPMFFQSIKLSQNGKLGKGVSSRRDGRKDSSSTKSGGGFSFSISKKTKLF